MNIARAKYNDKENKTILVFLDNGDTGIVTTDGVYRKHTYLYEKYIEGGGTIEPFETEEERRAREVKEAIEKIGEHIYRYYSETKQSQDRSHQAYAQSVIVAITAQTDSPVTLDALTVEIAGVVLQIGAGALTLDGYVSSKPKELQEHYEKLAKIGLRLKWAKSCIDEGKAAIAEQREPNYPPFPTFERSENENDNANA